MSVLLRCPSAGDDHLWRRSLQILVVVVIGSLACTPLRAENAAVCPKENTDECTRYQHLVAGMDSGDLVVQLTSLRAASQELDPAFRALIFGKALKSNDLRLRTAGLRYVLASRSTFDFVVEPPIHPTPAQQSVFQRYGTLTFHNVKVNEKTDEITAIVVNQGASGAMIRGGFELGWPYCRLHMTSGEEDVIKGTLRCQYPNAESVELKVSIELG